MTTAKRPQIEGLFSCIGKKQHKKQLVGWICHCQGASAAAVAEQPIFVAGTQEVLPVESLSSGLTTYCRKLTNLNPAGTLPDRKTWEKRAVYALYACLLATAALYILAFLQVFNGFKPWLAFDEFEYYLYARSYALTGSLRSPVLEYGAESAVGGFGTHGFLYALLGGLYWRHLWPQAEVVAAANFVYVCLGCAFFWWAAPGQARQKAGTLFLCLAFPVLARFTFSYMQESLQFLFAMPACVALWHVYHGKRKAGLVFFLITVLTAALFRLNWLFWLAGLFPLFRVAWQRAAFLAGCALVLCLAFFGYHGLFFAPYLPGFIPGFLQLLKAGDTGGAFAFWAGHLQHNTYFFWRYFYVDMPFYYPVKLMGPCLAVFFFWYGYRQRAPLAQAAGWLLASGLLSVYLLYDIFDWRELRALAPLYYLSFFVVWQLPKKRPAWLLTGLALMLSPFVLAFAAGCIGKYKAAHQRYLGAYQTAEELKLLGFVADPSVGPVVLPQELAWHGQVFPLLLPVVGKGGVPMRYNIQGRSLNARPDGPYAYLLYPRPPTDYPDSLQLLIEAHSYYLYRAYGGERP